MRVERTRKPAKCPSCGEAPVASILYGLPVFDDDLEQAMAEGRISLGAVARRLMHRLGSARTANWRFSGQRKTTAE